MASYNGEGPFCRPCCFPGRAVSGTINLDSEEGNVFWIILVSSHSCLENWHSTISHPWNSNAMPLQVPLDLTGCFFNPEIDACWSWSRNIDCLVGDQTTVRNGLKSESRNFIWDVVRRFNAIFGYLWTEHVWGILFRWSNSSGLQRVAVADDASLT